MWEELALWWLCSWMRSPKTHCRRIESSTTLLILTVALSLGLATPMVWIRFYVSLFVTKLFRWDDAFITLSWLIFIAYSTLATAALAIDPSLQEIAIPSNIDVTVQYGLTILNDADPNAGLLEAYILSAAGQLGLSGYGFGPPAPVAEPASVAVLGIALAGFTLLSARRRWTGVPDRARVRAA